MNSPDETFLSDRISSAIICGITNGMNWEQAGHLASHAAARIVGQLGARLEQRFTKEEIKAFQV